MSSPNKVAAAVPAVHSSKPKAVVHQTAAATIPLPAVASMPAPVAAAPKANAIAPKVTPKPSETVQKSKDSDHSPQQEKAPPAAQIAVNISASSQNVSPAPIAKQPHQTAKVGPSMPVPPANELRKPIALKVAKEGLPAAEVKKPPEVGQAAAAKQEPQGERGTLAAAASQRPNESKTVVAHNAKETSQQESEKKKKMDEVQQREETQVVPQQQPDASKKSFWEDIRILSRAEDLDPFTANFATSAAPGEAPLVMPLSQLIPAAEPVAVSTENNATHREEEVAPLTKLRKSQPTFGKGASVGKMVEATNALAKNSTLLGNFELSPEDLAVTTAIKRQFIPPPPHPAASATHPTLPQSSSKELQRLLSGIPPATELAHGLRPQKPTSLQNAEEIIRTMQLEESQPRDRQNIRAGKPPSIASWTVPSPPPQSLASEVVRSLFLQPLQTMELVVRASAPVSNQSANNPLSHLAPAVGSRRDEKVLRFAAEPVVYEDLQRASVDASEATKRSSKPDGDGETDPVFGSSNKADSPPVATRKPRLQSPPNPWKAELEAANLISVDKNHQAASSPAVDDTIALDHRKENAKRQIQALLTPSPTSDLWHASLNAMTAISTERTHAIAARQRDPFLSPQYLNEQAQFWSAQGGKKEVSPIAGFGSSPPPPLPLRESGNERTRNPLVGVDEHDLNQNVVSKRDQQQAWAFYPKVLSDATRRTTAIPTGPPLPPLEFDSQIDMATIRELTTPPPHLDNPTNNNSVDRCDNDEKDRDAPSPLLVVKDLTPGNDSPLPIRRNLLRRELSGNSPVEQSASFDHAFAHCAPVPTPQAGGPSLQVDDAALAQAAVTGNSFIVAQEIQQILHTTTIDPAVMEQKGAKQKKDNAQQPVDVPVVATEKRSAQQESPLLQQQTSFVLNDSILANNGHAPAAMVVPVSQDRPNDEEKKASARKEAAAEEKSPSPNPTTPKAEVKNHPPLTIAAVTKQGEENWVKQVKKWQKDVREGTPRRPERVASIPCVSERLSHSQESLGLSEGTAQHISPLLKEQLRESTPRPKPTPMMLPDTPLPPPPCEAVAETPAVVLLDQYAMLAVGQSPLIQLQAPSPEELAPQPTPLMMGAPAVENVDSLERLEPLHGLGPPSVRLLQEAQRQSLKGWSKSSYAGPPAPVPSQAATLLHPQVNEHSVHSPWMTQFEAMNRRFEAVGKPLSMRGVLDEAGSPNHWAHHKHEGGAPEKDFVVDDPFALPPPQTEQRRKLLGLMRCAEEITLRKKRGDPLPGNERFYGVQMPPLSIDTTAFSMGAQRDIASSSALSSDNFNGQPSSRKGFDFLSDALQRGTKTGQEGSSSPLGVWVGSASPPVMEEVRAYKTRVMRHQDEDERYPSSSSALRNDSTVARGGLFDWSSRPPHQNHVASPSPAVAPVQPSAVSQNENGDDDSLFHAVFQAM